VLSKEWTASPLHVLGIIQVDIQIAEMQFDAVVQPRVLRAAGQF
jgi:hypothetical protein